MPAEINLLRAKTRFSPEVVALIGQLRRISIIVFGVVLILAVAVGTSFFYLQLSLSALVNQKSQLLATVTANARKETLYRSIKTELGIASRVLNSQKNWSGVVGDVLKLAPPSTLTAFSVDDRSHFLLTLNTANIEEAGNIASSIIAMAGQNKIKDPLLESLTVDKTGAIRLMISFTPIIP